MFGSSFGFISEIYLVVISDLSSKRMFGSGFGVIFKGCLVAVLGLSLRDIC